MDVWRLCLSFHNHSFYSFIFVDLLLFLVAPIYPSFFCFEQSICSFRCWSDMIVPKAEYLYPYPLWVLKYSWGDCLHFISFPPRFFLWIDQEEEEVDEKNQRVSFSLNFCFRL